MLGQVLNNVSFKAVRMNTVKDEEKAKEAVAKEGYDPNGFSFRINDKGSIEISTSEETVQKLKEYYKGIYSTNLLECSPDVDTWAEDSAIDRGVELERRLGQRLKGQHSISYTGETEKADDDFIRKFVMIDGE